MEIFRQWMEAATASEPNDPNAAALATSTPDGRPSVRMVLLKSWDDAGFNFFTNAESHKGRELTENPHAALCLHWKGLRRQIRAEGTTSELPAEAADDYFHSRSRGSQIAAAVSAQSRPLARRAVLEEAVATFTAQHEGQTIPRPGFWKGYRLKPTIIEFWMDGKDRLHDRVLFTATDSGWSRELLYP
jgi:pyridoxamine 5'-phosphate oxidase